MLPFHPERVKAVIAWIDRAKLKFIDRRSLLNDPVDSQHLAHHDLERGYKNDRLLLLWLIRSNNI